MKLFNTLFLLFLLNTLIAQDWNKMAIESMPQALDELEACLSIPNHALDKDDILDNIVFLEKAFEKRGFETKRIETTGNPLLFAEWKHPKASETALFYMHFDGQKVDARNWDQADPFKPVYKMPTADGWEATSSKEYDPEKRIFARSASDDKGPIIAFLNSIDNLKKVGKMPAFSVKVILDSEEEMSSGPLAKAVAKHKDLLMADYLIINDGPVHLSGKPTIVFGCRGIMTLNLTTYGPIRPQHSGHYGNYAPNPGFRLAQLLASMKDADGRVIIPNYYAGIDIDAPLEKMLAAVPDDEEQIGELLAIAKPELVGQNYQESLQYPSLNVRGMQSAYVGRQARTIVPSTATAAIDIRLVPESNPDSLVKHIQAHIRNQGYHIVDSLPSMDLRMKHPKIVFMKKVTEAVLPFRTDLSHPIGAWAKQAIVAEFKETPIEIRIMGGTVPITTFINTLDIPALIVPMVNSDNNQHSPNENLSLAYFKNSIRSFCALLTQAIK